MVLKIRLSKEYGIPPSEIGQRLSSKDVGQILAYEHLQDELVNEARRAAELEAKAKEQRSKAMR